jgi:predicted metal-binding transcription factor (methanogenesis marker protein 9)
MWMLFELPSHCGTGKARDSIWRFCAKRCFIMHGLSTASFTSSRFIGVGFTPVHDRTRFPAPYGTCLDVLLPCGANGPCVYSIVITKRFIS